MTVTRLILAPLGLFSRRFSALVGGTGAYFCCLCSARRC